MRSHSGVSASGVRRPWSPEPIAGDWSRSFSTCSRTPFALHLPAERDGQVEVVVSDTGIGIPRDKLGLIFEPFVQVENGLTRKVGGTGLGLTISRALARGMGGDLTADSDGTSWAAFTLTLPSAARDRAWRDDEDPTAVAATTT